MRTSLPALSEQTSQRAQHKAHIWIGVGLHSQRAQHVRQDGLEGVRHGIAVLSSDPAPLCQPACRPSSLPPPATPGHRPLTIGGTPDPAVVAGLTSRSWQGKVKRIK